MGTTHEEIWDDFWEDADPQDLHDLPGDLGEIARELGMDAVRYFVEQWGGMQFYVPSRSTVEREVLERHIRNKFDGTNAGALAARYRVSRNFVYQCVNVNDGQGELEFE